MSSIRDLWGSTTGLLQRFDKRNNLTLDVALPLFEEEVSEFAMVCLNNQLANACEEMADVIVTMIDNVIAIGGTLQDIESGIAFVVDKNNRKTHKTHFIDEAGKIRRRSVNPEVVSSE